LEAAFLVPLLLPLTVACTHLGMPLTALFLVAGMFVPPLLLALADDLAIHRVACQLLPMIISPAPALALRPAADHLLRTVSGRQKETMAMGTTAWRAQTNSSELRDDSLRRIETMRAGKI
jgi:hypothetical protein